MGRGCSDVHPVRRPHAERTQRRPRLPATGRFHGRVPPTRTTRAEGRDRPVSRGRRQQRMGDSGMNDDTEIIDGIDVDHLEDRPDELEHVAIEEGPDGGLQALPFRESGPVPGYVEIDVDLMEWGAVCAHVQEQTDYDRPINFHQIPTAEWGFV